jgi:hypothetical protein
MAHSKGNWTVGKTGGTVVTDDETGFPESTGHCDKDYYGGNLIAESILKLDDARLISAAPCLLRACKMALSKLELTPSDQRGHDHEGIIILLKTAIEIAEQ